MVWRVFTIIFVCIFLNKSIIAQSIQFYHLGVEDALVLAKQQKKKLFIDTYAPWCIPCKRMDKVFRDKELANFFNEHFINVKINMDEPYGKQMNLEYQVIFLPTLLILNEEGYVLHRSEQEMSAIELLKLGKIAEDPSQLGVNTSYEMTEISPNVDDYKEIEKEAKSNSEYKPEDIRITQPKLEPLENSSEEKILYRLDSKSNQVQPEFLYQEAYFRMQLMDGSHRKAASAYLATQSDWSSEKNIRFIFDFLYSTESQEFNYLINNKVDFENLLGKESIEQSLAILIYNRLQNGFPRPNLKEAIALYSYLDIGKAEERAHQYMLQRMYQEERYDEYLSFAESYLYNINAKDDLVVHNWVRLKALSVSTNSALKKLIKKMTELVSAHPDNFYYHYTLAELYFINRDKVNAELEAAKSMELALKAKANTKAIQELIRKIQLL